jgi:hypothetical protein
LRSRRKNRKPSRKAYANIKMLKNNRFPCVPAKWNCVFGKRRDSYLCNAQLPHTVRFGLHGRALPVLQHRRSEVSDRFADCAGRQVAILDSFAFNTRIGMASALACSGRPEEAVVLPGWPGTATTMVLRLSGATPTALRSCVASRSRRGQCGPGRKAESGRRPTCDNIEPKAVNRSRADTIRLNRSQFLRRE